MSLTMARARAALDAALVDADYIEWAELGAAMAGTSTGTVSTRVPATNVTLEAAVDMTTYARKGIDVASPPQLSDPCTAGGACTIRFWRFTTAATLGTPQTNWNQLTSDVVLAAGEQIRINDAGIGERWDAG